MRWWWWQIVLVVLALAGAWFACSGEGGWRERNWLAQDSQKTFHDPCRRSRCFCLGSLQISREHMIWALHRSNQHGKCQSPSGHWERSGMQAPV